MRHLIDKCSLDKQPWTNIPVYIEDMVPFNKTILQTQEKWFYLGFQQIILCLYNIIGLFTINWKQAMLDLQFKHLQVSLQQDPHGGSPVLMIELQPQFVKSILGMSKLWVAFCVIRLSIWPCLALLDWQINSNTFVLPEIVYSVSLVFSLHVLLFSILFYINAFKVPHLTSMEDLWRLFVEDGWQEMPLLLKREMDNYYVFLKVNLICSQPHILWETLMNGHTLDTQLRTFSEIHGFLDHLFSHQFQYGEVTCLIKVIDEILLIPWGFLLLSIRVFHWSCFPQILSVRPNAMWLWRMQVAEPSSSITGPNDILAYRRLCVVSILMKSSQEQWHKWAAGSISDDHDIWMTLIRH